MNYGDKKKECEKNRGRVIESENAAENSGRR
jgi:hypothetical protein